MMSGVLMAEFYWSWVGVTPCVSIDADRCPGLRLICLVISTVDVLTLLAVSATITSG